MNEAEHTKIRCIPSKNEINVYENAGGGITIRETTGFDGESHVSIHIDDVDQVIQWLREIKAEMEAV